MLHNSVFFDSQLVNSTTVSYDAIDITDHLTGTSESEPEFT